jgi:sugar phosphate isomerase/epimerase
LSAEELLKRAAAQGAEEAAKYLSSAKLRVTGWELPLDLSADDEELDAGLVRLRGLVEVAKSVGFEGCSTDILPKSDNLPYHENFERHRARLSKCCEILGLQGLSLGVGLRAAASLRAEARHQFIHQAEELLTLLKTIDAANIGLVLDSWNWRLGGGGTNQLNELPGRQVVEVKLADLPADIDPKDASDKDRVLPSEDSIGEYGAMLRALAEMGFEGPVSIVPHPQKVSNLKRDASVEACSKLLEQIWIAAGLNKSGKLAPASA